MAMERVETQTQNEIRFNLWIPPSVNHCYFTDKRGRRILTKKAKEWMNSAYLLAVQTRNKANWQLSKGEKLILELTFYWHLMRVGH